MDIIHTAGQCIYVCVLCVARSDVTVGIYTPDFTALSLFTFTFHPVHATASFPIKTGNRRTKDSGGLHLHSSTTLVTPTASGRSQRLEHAPRRPAGRRGCTGVRLSRRPGPGPRRPSHARHPPTLVISSDAGAMGPAPRRRAPRRCSSAPQRPARLALARRDRPTAPLAPALAPMLAPVC